MYYDFVTLFIEKKLMSDFLKESIHSSLLNQIDDSTTTSVSIRIPVSLNNQLDELSISLDRSKSFLMNKYIEAGVRETNEIIRENDKDSSIDDFCIEKKEKEKLDSFFISSTSFLLNTNYNNDVDTHFSMIKNKEAAAFCNGWKESINRLSIGDKVFLYQSGVGIVGFGVVDSELIKSEYKNINDNKFSKKLTKFKTGFKAISAKEIKEIKESTFEKCDGKGINFRKTMVKISNSLSSKLEVKIDKSEA